MLIFLRLENRWLLSIIQTILVMKLVYAFFLAMLFHCTGNATTWNVAVANLSFNPATINAVIGDVIQFNLIGYQVTTQLPVAVG